MKKTLLLSLVSALSCSAALASTKATVVETVNPCNAWSLEASVGSVYAMNSLMGNGTKKFGMVGPELTLVHNYDCKKAFTLRGSALYGRHGHAGFNPDGSLTSLGKLDVMLMPGFRYTHTLNPHTSVFAGVNVGVIFTDINKEHTYNLNGGGAESAWGFAGSAELGIKYSFNYKWNVFAAYQISTNTARPTVNDHKQSMQGYNGFRVGVGYTF